MPDSKPSNQAGRSVGLSLLGNGLAGTAGTAAVVYSFNSTAPVVGFIRLALGAVALLLLAPFFGGKVNKIPRLLTRPGIWIMAISSASYQGFFFASVERSGVATAALVTTGCIPVSAGLVTGPPLDVGSLWKDKPTLLYVSDTFQLLLLLASI